MSHPFVTFLSPHSQPCEFRVEVILLNNCYICVAENVMIACISGVSWVIGFLIIVRRDREGCILSTKSEQTYMGSLTRVVVMMMTTSAGATEVSFHSQHVLPFPLDSSHCLSKFTCSTCTRCSHIFFSPPEFLICLKSTNFMSKIPPKSRIIQTHLFSTYA